MSVQSTDNFSVSTRLAELRGLPADFPLVTRWVNAPAVRPRCPCCLCSALCRYPNHYANCGGEQPHSSSKLFLEVLVLCISKPLSLQGQFYSRHSQQQQHCARSPHTICRCLHHSQWSWFIASHRLTLLWEHGP